MKYTTAGPEVIGDVTRDRIALYRTTASACECPANTFQPGPCKHIMAVNQGCSCPESLLMRSAHGKVTRICAEERCEQSAILRQAMLNDGATEVPEGPEYKICGVCELELLPRATPDEVLMRYCYYGDHWLKFICVACGDLATGLDPEGIAACASHETGTRELVA